MRLEKKEFTTASGKVFTLLVEPSNGASLVWAQVQTRNFDEVNDLYDLGEMDPVENAFRADLDNNGFEEFYFTTRSVGSGSYSTIYGFASNRDKSVSRIYCEEIGDSQMNEGGFFNGFRGHNQFKLENGELVDVFPVYSDGDINANPTGGQTRVRYELIAGEASWILRPAGRNK